jgi:hypothetical protein
VAYLLKARTVEPNRPLLGNGCVTHINGVTVGRCVFCEVVPRLYNDDQLSLQKSLETAIRRVGGWCEMTVSLRGREPGSRETSTGEDSRLRRLSTCCSEQHIV